MQSIYNSGYSAVGPVLPGGTQIVGPQRRFLFVAPWPWYEVDPGELSGSNALTRNAADLVVVAPRSDGQDALVCFFCSSEQTSLEGQSPSKTARRIASEAGIKLVEVRKIILDGRRGLLVTGRDDRTGSETFLLYAPNPEFLLVGRGDVPAGTASGYGLHVRSMLASWQWG